MPRSIARLGKFFFVVLCVLYPWLAHSAVLASEAAPVRFIASLIPIVGLTLLLSKRGRLRPLAAACVIIGGAAFVLLSMQEHWNPALSYGLPHAAINVFLFWFFARTLRSGLEPLITRVARRVHGYLTPEIAAYTRNVTLAWSVFFIAQIFISLLLYSFAPFSVWLLFISFSTFPLLALMFLGEFFIRVIFHPDHPRVPVGKVIRVFAQDFSGAPRANAP